MFTTARLQVILEIARHGTIVAAAELLMERGAREVWAMATHGVLSGPAVDRLKNSKLDKVVVPQEHIDLLRRYYRPEVERLKGLMPELDLSLWPHFTDLA